MSYYIDVGEQDKALASQIAKDQETLAAIHQTVADTRDRTNDLRQETAAQKRALDQQPARSSRRPRPQLKKLEKRRRQGARASSRRATPRSPATRPTPPRPSSARPRPTRRQLAEQDRRAHREAGPQRGNIPSAVQRHAALADGRLHVISGNFGCSVVRVLRAGQRLRPLPQRHRPGRPVRHARSRPSGAGTVVYVGWNYADGADPAWIVVIAHSRNLRTWYAHMQPRSRSASGRQLGQDGPGHRLRGQHRPLDRRPPALDGRAQRQLREPAPVPLGRGATRAAARRVHAPSMPAGRPWRRPC